MGKTVTDLQDRVLASAFANQTILITGATGLIGSNIVWYLAELNDRQNANIRIIALFRNEQKRNQQFSGLQNRKNVIFVKCDLMENYIPYKSNVDFIIHGAGYNGGMKMHLKDPVSMLETGIFGTKVVLDFAYRHGCRGLLYLSSYEVYGDGTTEGLIDERRRCRLDTFSLRSIYAEIKMACESLLCAYSSKYGLSVYSARLASTFGNGVRYDDPRFFAEFARCILEGKDIVLKSEGKTVRSYLDVEDAATAFLYILARGENCSAYNVTNMENEISIKDMALKMIEVTKAPVRVVLEKGCDAASLGFRREGRTVMDATKIQSLGWKPVHTLDETILSLIHSMENARPLNIISKEDHQWQK